MIAELLQELRKYYATLEDGDILIAALEELLAQQSQAEHSVAKQSEAKHSKAKHSQVEGSRDE